MPEERQSLTKVFWALIALCAVGVVVALSYGLAGLSYLFFAAPVLAGLILVFAFRRRTRLPALVFGGLLLLFWVNMKYGTKLGYWKRQHDQKRWEAAALEFQGLLSQKRSEDAARFVRRDSVITEDHWRGAYLPSVLCYYGSEVFTPQLLRAIQKDGDLLDYDLLAAAMKCDTTDGIDAVLAAGVSPNARRGISEETALMLSNSLPNMEYLIEHGADVNARTGTGESALMFQHKAAVVRMLLAQGADASALAEGGKTVFFYGSEYDLELAECFSLLCAAGADATAKSDAGHTALTNMSLDWNAAAADVLVACGADPLETSRFGKTALERALPHIAASNLRWPGLGLDGAYGALLLSRAVHQPYHEAALLLLEARANPVLPGFDGRPAIDIMSQPEYANSDAYKLIYERLHSLAEAYRSQADP